MFVFTGAIADHRDMDDEWIIEREPDEAVEEHREWVEQWKRLFPGCRARPVDNSEVDRSRNSG
jgi:hypothetical protein